jgi:RNA polymerase sigma factor (sigma-70 family)
MTAGISGSLGRQLHLAAGLQDRDDPADGPLLDRFLHGDDAAGRDTAFAEIVRRHGPMVLGVCRRVTGNPHDAEDAFQAAFLVLVGRAAELTGRTTVGDWLYGVAYRTALKARAMAVKRRLKEAAAARAVSQEPGEPPDWLPILDRELNRLPQKYREAIVLCELECRSRKEVADRLGIPEGTLSSRLAAGRKKLAERLRRCGLAVPVGAVLAAAGQADGLSRSLAASTIATAGRVASGEPVPLELHALVLEGVRAMTSRTITLGRWLLISLALAAGTGAAICALAPRSHEAAARTVERAAAIPDRVDACRKIDVGENARRFEISRDGRLLAVHSTRTARRENTNDEYDFFATIVVFDFKTGKEIISFGEVKNATPVQVSFAADSKTLILSYRGRIQEGDRLELWDARTATLRKTIEMDYGRIVPKFAPDPASNRVAVLDAGDRDRDPKIQGLQGGVRIWDTEKGESLRALRGHQHLAICVAYPPDGRRIATGGDNDQTVRMWEVKTGKNLWIYNGAGPIIALAFAPDGRSVAAAQGRQIRILDAAAGDLLRTLEGDPQSYLGIAYAMDGKTILGVGRKQDQQKSVGMVEVFSAATGDSLRVIEGARHGAFAPDGSLAVLGEDGVIRVWPSIPMPRGVERAPAGESPVSTIAAPVPVPAWKKEFSETYALKPGEVVKRIAPPYPKSREEFFKAIWGPGRDDKYGDYFSVFLWKGGKVEIGRMTVPVKPEEGIRLLQLFGRLGISLQHVEGDAALLQSHVTGDFVLREGASTKEIAAALERILRTECKLPVRLREIEAEREVVVVRGTFTSKPREGRKKNEIDIFSKQPYPNSGAGGGTGSFAEFLDGVEAFTSTRLLSEVKDPPSGNVSWYFHARSPFTEQEYAEDRDPESVCKTVTAQTGLEFKAEKRKVPILRVEREEGK